MNSTCQVLFSSSTELYWYPDSTRTKKKVTPLESSHRHHRPSRAASARAARRRRFPPKREAMAPGCRAFSACRERRVGSLVGQDRPQDHSNSSECEYTGIRAASQTSSTTPDEMAHIHRIVPPRCRSETSWLRARRVLHDRFCTQQLNWCAVDLLWLRLLCGACCVFTSVLVYALYNPIL